MTRWWHPRSVRTRLTLWHLVALVLVVTVYAGGVFAFVRHDVRADLDQRLREDLDRVEDLFGRSPDGTLTPLVVDRDAGPRDPVTRFGPWMCVWSIAGRPLYCDPYAPGPLTAIPLTGATSAVRCRSVYAAGHGWIRVATQVQEDVGGVAAVVRVARSEEAIRSEMSSLLLVLAGALPVAILFAGIAGYLVAGRALGPVARLTEAAAGITAARLDDRLPVENPDDELGRLATIFNLTFSRLGASFDQLRRFTADASHEMRTPLTAIRAVGEVGLRERHGESAYREIIGSMLEEADRLSRLVESLLMIARAEGGQTRIVREEVNLALLASEVVDELAVLAEDRQQSITVDASRPCLVLADRLLLRQALVNLLDNAIKYSPVGAPILVSVEAAGSEKIVSVADSGPGIAPEHMERIFERFYRIDASRSRSIEGAGLGLSIARWAVQANGGRIDVTRGDAGGSIFRIVLPGRRDETTASAATDDVARTM